MTKEQIEKLKAFANDMNDYFSDSTEMDGADFLERAVKHGILKEAIATQADIDAFDFNQYDLVPGETIYLPTDLIKAVKED